MIARTRRTFSLIEVVIVLAILSVVLFLVFTTLFSSGTQVETASTELAAQSRARRVAHVIADDLRDAALLSLSPNSFTDATALDYQIASGFDSGSGDMIVTPPSAIGTKRIEFTNGRIDKRDLNRGGALFTYTLAEDVSDMRLTLEGTNQIRIRVEVQATNSVDGSVSLAVSEVVILLRNQGNISN